ncbi:MAG: ferritin [Paraprevotella sp.]|nr:ferritin [Paraprevotella sp.]
MWSSNLYLSMSFYLAKEGLDGCASWMKKQSQEELGHAYEMAAYIIKRGGVARVDKVDVVPQEWDGVVEVFQNMYEHECEISKLIEAVVRVAGEEKDMPTQDFLWKYVREQVEEEATAQSLVEKFRKAGKSALLFIDDKLGQRA